MRQSPYTVAELIEFLRQMDQEALVVLSRDPEGNGFSELHQVGTNTYRDGQIGIEKLTPELKKAGYSKEDILAGGVKAIVLWPS
jgi:hypothetical protein